MADPIKQLYELKGPKVAEALKKRGFEAYYVSDNTQAVEKILQII